MKLKNLTLALLAAGALGLTACSTTTKTSPGGYGAADGTSASGVGAQASLSGQDMRRRSTTEAPHEQTYYFDFDSNKVYEQDFASISAQGRYLASNGSSKVVLAGHTDERGSREYNIALGERRANAVAELLKSDGAKGNQIHVVSYGSEKPVAEGHDESAFRVNRRAELAYKEGSKG